MHNLPDNLPIPSDDGACDGLVGMRLPSLQLPSTSGQPMDLSLLPGRTVVYIYPRTGRPEEEDSPAWDALPGARGCTPQTCGFRDCFEDFSSVGVLMFGLSTQTTPYQQEAVDRLRLPYALLSDAELAFAYALGLPTFHFEPYPGESPVHLKRMALVIRDGIIEKVFYPVFPPDRNAEEVWEWIILN